MQSADDILESALAAFHGGDLDEAERQCATVLEGEEHPYALHILGLVRHRQGRTSDAVGLLENAERIGGEHPENYLHRGMMLLRLVKDDPLAAPDGLARAERCFRRAIEMAPGAAQPRAEFSDMLNRMGRVEDAYELLRPLLVDGAAPAMILDAYSRLAPALERSGDALGLLQAALAGGALSGADEIRLLAAEANLLDRAGDFERAFATMQRSNEMKYQGVTAPDFERHVDAIIAAFDGAIAAGLPHSDNRSELPIYVVGLPRSGTTLVEQILASHTEVAGGGEIKNVIDLVSRMPGIAAGRAYPEAIAGLDEAVLGRLGGEQVDYLTRIAGGASRVTNKQPTNFIYLGLIQMLTPNARVINCRRNPLDTCVSLYFQSWDVPEYYIKTMDSLAHFSRGFERLMEYWHRTLELPILDVEYEALVSDHEAKIREMLDFLGLEWDEACLDFHRNSRFVHTASHDQVRRPIYTGSMERWRRYERHLGPLREILGV